MNQLAVPSDDDHALLRGMTFVIRETTPVRRLSGFQSKHRLPDSYDQRSQAFVSTVGTPLIQSDLDHVFAGLRKVYGLKRRQLEVTESQEGFGTIRTPHFLYSNCVFQSESEWTTAIWQRELSQIEDLSILLDGRCDELFAEVFDTIEFQPSAPIQLEKLVDHIEELEDPRVQVDFDRQLTYCNLRLEGSPLVIQAQRDAFRITHPTPSSPRELFDGILQIQQNLVDFRKLS